MPELTPDQQQMKQQVREAHEALAAVYAMVERTYGPKAAGGALVILAGTFAGASHDNLCFWTAQFSAAYNFAHQQQETAPKQQPVVYFKDGDNGSVN